MGGAPKTALDEKYKAVLKQEKAWANSVARALIKPKPLSVWEVMIPVLLILNLLKSKGEKEVLVKNLLFTKELALEAALDMVRRGESRDAVLAPIEEKTRGLLSSVENGIYSEHIRTKQLKEINLLIDHYHKLLQVDGGDYASLVMNAYQRPEAYMTFLAQLRDAEKEVSQAAEQTLGSRADAETVSTLEEATDRIRMAVARRIFQTTH
ncbi:MAG: NF038143 family protein [Desulfobacteraceae bacterium]|jgi:uncharacterized Fe-S cluster-containing radical SAM superfamily enzyme